MVLTNPEDSSQPVDITQSPPAGTDDVDSPSQLRGAFIHYLRARPTGGDSESRGFDDSRADRIRGRDRMLGKLLQNPGRHRLSVGNFAMIERRSTPYSLIRRRLA